MMETLNYMMAGYLVIWGLAFGFVFNLWSRSRRLESELEKILRGVVNFVGQSVLTSERQRISGPGY